MAGGRGGVSIVSTKSLLKHLFSNLSLQTVLGFVEWFIANIFFMKWEKLVSIITQPKTVYGIPMAFIKSLKLKTPGSKWATEDNVTILQHFKRE